MVRKRAPVSDSELQILHALWKEGPATVRDVSTRLAPQRRPWAYNTIQTLLNRLEAKGYVKADKTGFAHTYRARVTREKFLAQQLRELAEKVCEGTTTPLVAAFVRRHRFRPEEIAEFRRLLDEFDRTKEKS
ncbi:MAG: BlaI/MecI/CopY family transcriptional regulator [Candidatus Hydrogenedentes bacterium]|nr:BlaI/MecI/CopY family transcriptional regulator [Candidatus Hydrogenedentota bacterium]